MHLEDAKKRVDELHKLLNQMMFKNFTQNPGAAPFRPNNNMSMLSVMTYIYSYYYLPIIRLLTGYLGKVVVLLYILVTYKIPRHT